VHLYCAEFAYKQPSAALSSQTEWTYCVGRDSPGPRSRTLTCAAIEPLQGCMGAPSTELYVHGVNFHRDWI